MIGIRRRINALAAARKFTYGGAGSVTFAVRDVRRTHELELLGRDAAGTFELAGRIWRVGLGGIARVIRKREGRCLDRHALDSLHEMAEERAAAKLAVGHRLQPDIFLKSDDLTDGAVLDDVQFAFHHLSFAHLMPRLDQRLRAQQAADVIGVKRRGVVHFALPDAV